VENDDGDVVKAFQMPSDKPDSDLVSQSLKKMGMGGLIKPGEKGEAVAGPSSERPAPAARARKSSFAFVRPGAGDRKKSVAEERQEEDDRQIRFTIGGVGKRMTKDDFIKTVQKLPKNARREVVEQSSASQRVKTLAKQDPQPPKQPQQQSGEYLAESSAAASTGAGVFKQNWQGDGAEAGTSSTERPSSSSRSVSPGAGGTSRGTPETAAERKRRLAVLSSVMGDDDDNEGETAAERRRREAALGVSAAGGGDASDSDDDDTPRVPPPKRGIRFAEPERERAERD